MENETDMEALTNNQLKMYLKQHGLKISGRKADLTKRVLSHARENAAGDVLEYEEFCNSREDDTTSQLQSFEVLFLPEEDIQSLQRVRPC